MIGRGGKEMVEDTEDKEADGRKETEIARKCALSSPPCRTIIHHYLDPVHIPLLSLSLFLLPAHTYICL